MSAEDEGFSDMWIVRPQGPVTRPRATVTSGSAPLTSTVDQRVDNSTNKPLPWIAVSMLIAGISIAGACWAISEARQAERETRMLEYYLLELDAKVIAAGIKTADESIAKKLEKERKR